MKLYCIKKNGKFVKDFTDGEKLTIDFMKAEKYTNKKSAIIAAQEYGKRNGKGYTVVEI